MKVSMGQPNDVILDDLELLLREIDEFNKTLSNNKPSEIPQTLENYLKFVAKSGNTVFPWPHVRHLIRTKMVNAIQQFQEPTCPNETFVLERFDLFRQAAPFTVQRLTELILQPTRHYRKKEKFLRGLEKTVLVVSTIEPQSLTNDLEKNGNDTCNTSASSTEQDVDAPAFNRTITIDKDSISTVHPQLDVLNPSPSENVVVDPITTTVVSTSDDALNPNVSLASTSLISDSAVSAASAVEGIAPDKVIAVTSEDIVLSTIPDAAAAGILNMETDEGAGQDILTSSVEGINATSTPITLQSEDSLTSVHSQIDVLNPTASVENIVGDSVTTTVVSIPEDVLSQNISLASASILPEDVVATISTGDVITPDQVIAVTSEDIVLSTIPDPTSAEILSMETTEGQDILSSSMEGITAEISQDEPISSDHSQMDTLNSNTSSENVMDPVTTTAVNISGEIVEDDSGINSAEVISDEIAASTSTEDTITSDNLVTVTSEDALSTTTESVVTPADDSLNMETSEGQD